MYNPYITPDEDCWKWKRVEIHSYFLVVTKLMIRGNVVTVSNSELNETVTHSLRPD